MISHLKLVLALLSGGLLAVVVSFSLGYCKGKAVAGAEYSAKLTQLENEGLVKATKVAEAYSSVLETESEKKSKILGDYVKLRNAYDGLRHAATTVKVHSDSAAAASESAARGELLAECGERYASVARAADEHAADAMKLYNAWTAVRGVGEGG